MRSRLATAAAGIAVSLLVSAVLWWIFGSFVVFLFVPFVPFVVRGSTRIGSDPTVSECPNCGFSTADDSYEFCPRDGTRLASATTE